MLINMAAEGKVNVQNIVQHSASWEMINPIFTATNQE